MNCKDNDIAMIVKGDVQSNLGIIVQCKRRIGVHGLYPRTNCMELTKEILTFDSNTHQYCKSKVIPEEWLFPIHNQQGFDEMIKCAGYPQLRVNNEY